MSPIDLSKQAPRSPRHRIRGYALLARAIDKCRADIAGQAGDYHFNCPLDQMLFEFKHVNSDDFRAAVHTAETDDDVAYWLDRAGTPHTEQEIVDWSADREQLSFYHNPEKKQWFIDSCNAVGLDPAKATLFDFLEADDAASFQRAATV